MFRKIGRRKLVPFYDRGEIEDGAIAGRGLEICYLKEQTDLLFSQIQGSARVSLDDGSTVRINYDAHNGYPYTAVGRILIERNIIPRDQMSMQKIREWMEENPNEADELRRQNKSYVFFREVQLSDKDEAVGAQGVPLTPGRSIAVDKALHVYGTPFFIEGELPSKRRSEDAVPTAYDRPGYRFRHRRPPRAPILYFGAGFDAARCRPPAAQCTLRHAGAEDPRSAARGRSCRYPMIVRRRRLQKLFPQTAPSNNQKTAAPPPEVTVGDHHPACGRTASSGGSTAPAVQLPRRSRCASGAAAQVEELPPSASASPAPLSPSFEKHRRPI